METVDTVAPPARIYSGTATCANLLDADRLARYLSTGKVVTGDEWDRKILTEAAQNNTKFGLASFITFGGIACGWGDGYENEIIFGYGPISTKREATAKSWLQKHHYTRAVGGAFERFDGDSGSYAFGNGYWATASDNGGGNVLSQVVAHAPQWTHRANDTRPTPTKLSSRDVAPASGPYLSTAGLGGLELGKPIPADNAFVEFDADTCFASWLAKAPYGSAHLATQALDVLTEGHDRGAVLTGILLRDATIPTKSGIRVGDSLVTLQGTFAEFDEVVALGETTLYVIADKHGKIVFEVANADSPSGSYVAGQIRAISLMPASATDDLLSAEYWAPCTI